MVQIFLLHTSVVIIMLLATLIFIAGITRKWNNKRRWTAIKWTVVPISIFMSLLAFYISEFI